MLWIALYIPELSLQMALRAFASDTIAPPPLVVATGADNRPVVHAANKVAQALGIKAGISIASARALIQQGQTLSVIARHPVSELAAVHNLAGWTSQFTPSVSIKDAEGLLLEVAATLRMHDGLAMLLGRIRRGVHALGYRVSIGVAPTPLAAWVLAKARYQGYEIRVCQNKTELETRLANLPLALLDWPLDVLNKLLSLGIVCMADCLALPSDGFMKRFGAQHWADLQRMLGRVPDPRRYYLPPDTYQARAEFGFEINDAMALLFPLRRLLAEMEGYLHGRGAGVLDYAITLHHASRRSSANHTAIRIRVAKVERQCERLLALAREHLMNLALADTVSALSIQVDRLQPYREVSESWLPDPQQQPDTWFSLLDKLTARLGADHVYQLQALDDHRPEQSWQALAANVATHKATNAATNSHRPIASTVPRPLFLLATPRKLMVEQGLPRCHGAIHIISGPERIESGWWDARPAARDYFVGRNRHGETMWLYVNHAVNHATADWYLHGYFA